MECFVPALGNNIFVSHCHNAFIFTKFSNDGCRMLPFLSCSHGISFNCDNAFNGSSVHRFFVVFFAQFEFENSIFECR